MFSTILSFFETTVFGLVYQDPALLLNLVMMGIGLLLIFLGVRKQYEPCS